MRYRSFKNLVLSYLEEQKSFPDPKWNINYYWTGSEYIHEKDLAFWVQSKF